MACHITVLYGNFGASNGFHLMGVSSKGWSHVGLGMARAMKEELNMQMFDVTQALTDGLEKLMEAQVILDDTLAGLGDATEEALSAHGGREAVLLEFTGRRPDAVGGGALGVNQVLTDGEVLVPGLNESLPRAIGNITAPLDALIDLIEPSLLLIGKWEVTFGDKLQAGVEMFATAIDLVQKMFDQIMAQMAGGGGSDAYMEENTFTLFALSGKNNGITVQDLKDVSSIYSIAALNGEKAEDIHAKYDIDRDAFIDASEYKSLVLDDSLPYIMAVALRTYSTRLTAVAGSTRSARMRDEVAKELVGYLQLVAAKNMTKVGWIADLLGNGTLPMAFTASVMRNLALVADDPAALTTDDVGAVVIGAMSDLHPGYTTKAVNMMADADFWASEGFDTADQPVCVDRVTQWMAASFLQTGAEVSLRNLVQMLNGNAEANVPHNTQELIRTSPSAVSASTLGSLGRTLVEKNQARYFQRRHEALVARYDSLHRTSAAWSLFTRLLGGQMAARDDPQAASSVSAGKPAAKTTLQYMSYLAHNASANALLFQQASFNYSSQSSNAMDSFATTVQGMVKKFQSFLVLMVDYSGEEGVTRLRAQVKEFSDNAEKELKHAINLHIMGGNHTLLRLTPDPSSAAVPTSMGTWATLVSAMEALQSVLPTCIESLKASRQEASKSDAVLDSVFSVFEQKGAEIFENIAWHYKLTWTVYFVLFALITLGILYYGLWASGCAGEPTHTSDEYCPDYEAPTSCAERVKCCWTSCTHCLWHYSESEFCFWSMLLLGQLIVLVIFVVSIVLVLLAGVNIFLASGCAEVYVLGDPDICTQNLMVILNFMNTFNPGEQLGLPLSQMCANERLATCGIINQEMMLASALTTAGSVMAAVLTSMLLIESAVSHERARSRRLVSKLLQGSPEASLGGQ